MERFSSMAKSFSVKNYNDQNQIEFYSGILMGTLKLECVAIWAAPLQLKTDCLLWNLAERR